MCQVRAAGRHHRAPGRQGTAPRPTPRGVGPVESRVLPRIAGVGIGQCGNARGPRAGPRRRPRDARDRPRRARSRAVRGSCIIEFSTARTRTARPRRPDPMPRGPRSALAVLAPRFLARSNEVSCRHQKSTSQFQIRMRRRLRATDNTRCDGRATVATAGAGPARGREARPVRVRPGTCYIQLHRL